MIWIIGRPTSAGKSTFIRSGRFAALTCLPPKTPVVWPRQRLTKLANGDVIYHYNIVHRLFHNHRAALRARRRDIATRPTIMGFDDDSDWINVIELARPMRAVVLVTSKPTTRERMAERTRIEDQTSTGVEQRTYKAHMWWEIVQAVDLRALYADWCQTLDAHGIPYLLVSGEDDSYPVTTEVQAAELAGREVNHPRARSRATTVLGANE